MSAWMMLINAMLLPGEGKIVPQLRLVREPNSVLQRVEHVRKLLVH